MTYYKCKFNVSMVDFLLNSIINENNVLVLFSDKTMSSLVLFSDKFIFHCLCLSCIIKNNDK